MIKIKLFLLITLCIFFQQADAKQFRTESNLPGGIIELNYNLPTVKGSVDWASSCLVILQRSPVAPVVTSQPMKLAGHFSNFSREVDFDTKVDFFFNVVKSSYKYCPKKLKLSFGAMFPNFSDGRKPRSDDFANAISSKLFYLAIIPIPNGGKLSNESLIIPNFVIPVENPEKYHLEPGRAEGLNLIFNLLKEKSGNELKFLFQWINGEWRGEVQLYRKNFFFGANNSPTLYNLTGNAEDRLIGDKLIEEASKADPSTRIYFTLLAGMWGASTHFDPFFDACQDRLAKPDISFESMMDLDFPELSFESAFKLANEVPPNLSAFMFRFGPHVREVMSKERQAELLSFSKRLDWRGRAQIYRLMWSGLPLDPQMLAWEYPNGLDVAVGAFGIQDEPGYIKKWQAYLGLPTTNQP